ncbi:Mss4-like protein [Xylaria cf. heliscus]|nr:Mss4-like protein [Xylaria cf. heliscus]
MRIKTAKVGRTTKSAACRLVIFPDYSLFRLSCPSGKGKAKTLTMLATDREQPKEKKEGEGETAGEGEGTGEEEEDTLELIAHCLCQAQRFTARIPRSSLPLEAIYCHCTSCRRVTGSLYSTYVAWPGDGAAIAASTSLRRYHFAGPYSLLSCGVCSANMFAETRTDGDGPNSYGVQTGALANVAVPGLVKITHHVFLDDTLDGGAVPWLCDANADGTRPRLWRGHRAQGQELLSSHPWPATGEGEAGGGVPSEEDTDIPIRCHCGGIDLVLRRPMADFATRERSELPWFVDPASNKSRANFDACDSCRLWSGSDIYYWTFVLLRHLSFPPSSPPPPPPPKPDDQSRSQPQSQPTDFPISSLELKNAVASAADRRDPRLGSLAFYESSPDVQRYFCSRCSACVFYASDDRPEMVDLAVGLLDSGGGARAESLLAWDYGGKVGWRQDVIGGWREGFVESVEAAAERWRVDRGYPKSWRRVQLDEESASSG